MQYCYPIRHSAITYHVICVRSNNLEGVKFLLANKVKTCFKAFSETPLHTAADNNHAQIATLLLQNNRKPSSSQRN